MRPPDWASERGDSDERGAAGRARWARDDLRQRLDRLPDGHPSSPEYEELPGSGEPGLGQPPEYGELEDAELENGELDNGELAEGGDEGGDEGGHGRPAGRPAGDAGARPAAGTGGLASRRQPYRPWFTSGESPEPWFTADPGG